MLPFTPSRKSLVFVLVRHDARGPDVHEYDTGELNFVLRNL